MIALYVMAYTAGRGWIEMLRIDDVEYQHVLGLRLNVWTSIVLFILAAIYFVVVGRRRPGREAEVYTEERLAADRALAAEAAEADSSSVADADTESGTADAEAATAEAEPVPDAEPSSDPAD